MAPVTIKIYNSNRKIFLVLTGSALFVLLGFVLLSKQPDSMALSLAGIAFFGLCFLASAYTLFRNRTNPQPAYILNPAGLQINRCTSGHFIKWEKITGFSECKIQSRKFIAIHVDNPMEFMEQETHRIRKQNMSYNLQKFDTPFCISCAHTRSNYGTLWEMLHKFHSHYGKQADSTNP